MNWLNSTCIGGGIGFLLSAVLNFGDAKNIVPSCIVISNIYTCAIDDSIQTVSLLQENEIAKQIKISQPLDKVDLGCKLITITMPIIGHFISKAQAEYCIAGLLLSAALKTGDMFISDSDLQIALPDGYALVETLQSEDNLGITNHYDGFALGL